MYPADCGLCELLKDLINQANKHHSELCTEIGQLKRILNDILGNTNSVDNIVTNLINQTKGYLNRHLAEKFNKLINESTQSKFIPYTK